MPSSPPEVWLRGPIEGVPPLLQPVAHSLLQAREEVAAVMDGFPETLLWTRPAGAASAGFHLRHLSGVVDRLFTYARGEALSSEQRAVLAGEDRPPTAEVGAGELLSAFDRRVEAALSQLRETDERCLTDPRLVGRMQLPSTVQGLLFHAAEHTQRHLGQLLVTARVLRDRGADP